MAYVFSLVDPDHVFFHQRALQKHPHPLSRAAGSLADFTAHVAEHGKPQLVLLSYGHMRDLAETARKNPILRRKLGGAHIVILGGNAWANEQSILDEVRKKGARGLHVVDPPYKAEDILRLVTALGEAQAESSGRRVTPEMYQNALGLPPAPSSRAQHSRFAALKH